MKVVLRLGLLLLWPAVFVRSAYPAELPSAVEHLESLTPEEAVRQALEAHPKLAKAEAHLRQAQVRLAEASRWFRPNVSLYAGERLDADRHRFGIQVSQDIDALWDRSKQQAAGAEVSAAQQDLLIARQEAVREVSAAYDGWILAKLNAHRAALRRTHARTILEHAREQYDEGLIAASRLAELEKSSDEAERASAESCAHLSEAALRLRQAMGEVGAPCLS